MGPDVTDPLGQAAEVFGPQCRSTRSPLACVLMAFAHGTVDGKFTASAQSPEKHGHCL